MDECGKARWSASAAIYERRASAPAIVSALTGLTMCIVENHLAGRTRDLRAGHSRSKQ